MRRFFLDKRLLKSPPPEEIISNTRKRKSRLTKPCNESCAFVKIRIRRIPLLALHGIRHRTKFSVFDLALEVIKKLRDDSVANAPVDYHKSRNSMNTMIQDVATIQTRLQTKPVITRLYMENYLHSQGPDAKISHQFPPYKASVFD